MARALIIGGGIAGPVTAMALQRAGIEAAVHEAYPAGADDVGAFLVLFANGLAALAAIDADAVVREHSFPARTAEFLGADGAALGSRPLAGANGGAAPRTLSRSVLHRVLREEAARRGIPVHHGKRLVDRRTGPGGTVTALFADGTRAEGDVLVGADGIHSRTRTLLDPAAPAPRPTGQTTVCGRLRDPAHAVPPATYRMMYGTRGFFGCTTAPDGTTYWFANVPGAPGPGAGPAHWRHLVAQAFAGDGTPAAAMAAATGDDIVGTSAHDLQRTPVWHDRHTVLVGDAAHATAPNAAQGASLAIEDGVVLAQCLRDLPGIPRAFAAYERLRRGRAERVVALSAALAARLAGAADENTPQRGDDGGADWLTGYRIDWDARVG
ncbi:NAD(P)/FAD-dependent oxidoreductase [Streptomyces sp. NPDC049555]|uniref:NAD(P)/FAD-dependent oxidoreductase n=1 Tax=Streptomyces sp. NPDC049555 TaxID=3154930 RepID=UPI00343E592D